MTDSSAARTKGELDGLVHSCRLVAKRPLKMASILAIAASANVSLRAARASAEPVQATRADDFVASTGIGTSHATLSEVAALGVRHYRTTLEGAEPADYDAFYRNTGINGCFLPPNNPTMEGVIAALKALAPGVVEIVEGPNEPNNGFGTGNGDSGLYNLHFAGLTDTPAAVQYMKDLHPLLQDDPLLAHLPLASFTQLNLDEFPYVEVAGSYPFDMENGHPYPPNALPPGLGMDWSADDPNGFATPDPLGEHYGSIAWNIKAAHAEQSGPSAEYPPYIATETGYNITSQEARLKYFSYLHAAFFAAGAHRTYIFTLGPYENWGLLSDGPNGTWTRTPAFVALQHVLKTTADADWNKESLLWDLPEYEPAALDFSLIGAGPFVNYVLLQKADGSFQLLVWNAAVVWDWETNSVVSNDPVPVTLKLRDANLSSARIHTLRSDASGNYEVENVKISTDELPLSIPDSLMIVELFPSQADGGNDGTSSGGTAAGGQPLGGANSSDGSDADASAEPGCGCTVHSKQGQWLDAGFFAALCVGIPIARRQRRTARHP